MKYSFLIVILLLSYIQTSGLPLKRAEKYAFFGGRVSKFNRKTGLIYFRLDFENRKYLNTDDVVTFWNEGIDVRKCQGRIIGRTSEYLLVKILGNHYRCSASIGLAVGSYLKFHSEDMINNMTMGMELVKILLKKKTAVSGKALKAKENLDAHIEKVNSVNERYDILRKKLETEWQNQLHSLEEDRLTMLQEYKNTQKNLDDINAKLALYKIDEDNFSLDRWALDPKLYFKK